MRLRSALCATTVIGLVLVASPAHATPYCNLVVDQAGDGQHRAAPVLSSPTLDLLSGDVASGATTVVAVLRLASADTSNDPVAKLGIRWSLAFTVDGTDYALTLRRAAGTNDTKTAEMFVEGVAVTPPAFTVSGSSITWTVPRSAFPELATPGTAVFSTFAGMTLLAGGLADTMINGTATYPDQAASCVAAA